MALKICEDLAARIRAHGVQAYPRECCGALLGRDGEGVRDVLDVVPLENRRDDSPRNRFALSADDVRQAERVARERGLEVIGWFHSHPDHPAQPSEFDREHAWPWYSYVIVSVIAREPREISSWRLSDDRTRFLGEELEFVAQVPARREAACLT